MMSEEGWRPAGLPTQYRRCDGENSLKLWTTLRLPKSEVDDANIFIATACYGAAEPQIYMMQTEEERTWGCGVIFSVMHQQIQSDATSQFPCHTRGDNA